MPTCHAARFLHYSPIQAVSAFIGRGRQIQKNGNIQKSQPGSDAVKPLLQTEFSPRFFVFRCVAFTLIYGY
jgi:hypothetical protein